MNNFCMLQFDTMVKVVLSGTEWQITSFIFTDSISVKKNLVLQA